MTAVKREYSSIEAVYVFFCVDLRFSHSYSASRRIVDGAESAFLLVFDDLVGAFRALIRQIGITRSFSETEAHRS